MERASVEHLPTVKAALFVVLSLMRLPLTSHGRYMPHHMLFHIRTFLASLKPWMSKEHLVARVMAIPLCFPCSSTRI